MRDPVCDLVTGRMSELLAGDLPAAMRRELDPHLRSCRSCRGELDSFARLVADLKTMPDGLSSMDVAASVARSWTGIQRAIAVERREQPLPWFVQGLALAAAGVVIASALVRNSASLADRFTTLTGFSAFSPSSWFSMPDAWKPFLLPLLFVFFGAGVALAALPIFAVRAVPCSRT